jgi:hypothetical protein
MSVIYNLGDVPNWIEAIATSGALIATIILLRKEIISHRLDRADRRRAQASKISAWVGPFAHDPDAFISFPISVRNSSSEPVYGLKVQVVDPNLGNDGDIHYFTESPFSGPDFDVLGPGETDLRTYRVQYGGEGRCMTDPATRMVFRDSNGVTWLRDSDGLLREIDSKDFDEAVHGDGVSNK